MNRNQIYPYKINIYIFNAYFQNAYPRISQLIFRNAGANIEIDANQIDSDFIRITAKFNDLSNARNAFNDLQNVSKITRLILDYNTNSLVRQIPGNYIDEFERQVEFSNEEEDVDEKESEDVMANVLHDNRDNMFVISFPIGEYDNDYQDFLDNHEYDYRIITDDKYIYFYRNYQTARDAYGILISNTIIPNVVMSHRGVILLSSENDMIDNTRMFEFGQENSRCIIL
jgi:hypothetical protein